MLLNTKTKDKIMYGFGFKTTICGLLFIILIYVSIPIIETYPILLTAILFNLQLFKHR